MKYYSKVKKMCYTHEFCKYNFISRKEAVADDVLMITLDYGVVVMINFRLYEN